MFATESNFFFICAFALYLRGLYSFSSGYRIIYEIHTCLFTFILLQIRVDQFNTSPPTRVFLSVFEEVFNIFSALQSFPF